jgi:hypothetical protein
MVTTVNMKWLALSLLLFLPTLAYSADGSGDGDIQVESPCIGIYPDCWPEDYVLVWVRDLSTTSFSAVFVSTGPNLDQEFMVAMTTTNPNTSGQFFMSTTDFMATSFGIRTASSEIWPGMEPMFSFEAEDGNIYPPFIISGGAIYQDLSVVSPANGGRATYVFTLPEDGGTYIVKAVVDCPNTGSNSFYINIDEDALNSAMTWDVDPPTVGFEERAVSWRGSGTQILPENNPKTFALGRGLHTLYIRGRENGAKIDKVKLYRTDSSKVVWDTVSSSQTYNIAEALVVPLDTIPGSSAWDSVKITGTELEVVYKEPTTNDDGTAITDLKSVNLYYNSGGGETLAIEVPASSPTGGGIRIKRILIPLGEDTEAEVKFYFRAYNLAGEASANSPVIIKRLDKLAPKTPDL